MKLQDLENATSRLEQGAWIDKLPKLPGVRVKVRATGNTEYQRILAKFMRPLSDEQKSDAETFNQLETKLLVENLLLDYEGLDDFPYSPENARMLLTDERYLVFRRAVLNAAEKLANEDFKTTEADAKN